MTDRLYAAQTGALDRQVRHRVCSFYQNRVAAVYNESFPPAMSQDDALVRLARQIDAARKAERLLVDADEVVGLRRQGAERTASDLRGVCRIGEQQAVGGGAGSFAATYAPEHVPGSGHQPDPDQHAGPRRCRSPTRLSAQLVSTEKFLVPYVLEGEVRTYNQRMLERFEVNSRMLFFCVEAGTAGWRFFDWRTRHTGPVDRAIAGQPDGTAVLTSQEAFPDPIRRWIAVLT